LVRCYICDFDHFFAAALKMKLASSLSHFGKFVFGMSLAAVSPIASAAVVMLDDFSTSSNPIFGPPIPAAVTTNGTGFWNQRTLSLFNINSVTDRGINGVVTNGLLTFSNSFSARGTLELGYTFNFAQITQALSQATYFQVLIDQIQIDSFVVNVGGSARVNAQNGLPLVIAGSSDLTYFASPFNLQFRADYAADSAWDNLRIIFTCKAGATANDLKDLNAPDGCSTNGTVPIAPSAALLGLGLFAALASRRQRKST
jgi:MYXO-CTERM domain-containing protein